MPNALARHATTTETPAPNFGTRLSKSYQTPACIWMTGLSGAGKSTVARLVGSRLIELGHSAYVLDGDVLRAGLCGDLGFTAADRVEHIRRVSEMARILVDAGLIAIVAVISPFEKERAKARSNFDPGKFIEIFVDTPLAVCEQRDVKGLYRKARRNELPNFTGISSPYEPPTNPEITLHCGSESPLESAERVLAALRPFNIIGGNLPQREATTKEIHRQQKGGFANE